MAFDRLTVLKEYRTPQAFRAFARVYVLLVGALYGPYYVRLGMGQWSSSRQQNLGLALAFAVAMQIAFSGLFNVMLGLEDPFARRGGRGQTDSIHVPELCEVCRRALARIERDAECGWHTCSRQSSESGDASRILVGVSGIPVV